MGRYSASNIEVGDLVRYENDEYAFYRVACKLEYDVRLDDGNMFSYERIAERIRPSTNVTNPKPKRKIKPSDALRWFESMRRASLYAATGSIQAWCDAGDSRAYGEGRETVVGAILSLRAKLRKAGKL